MGKKFPGNVTPRAVERLCRIGCACVAVLLVALAVLAAPPAVAAGVILKVRDFGALPNDGQDDAAAIQRAFDAAIRQQAQRLDFETGRYDLMRTAGAYGSSNISLLGAKGLELRGAVDAKGEPATRLVRHWKMPAESVNTRLIFVRYAPDFTMRNFVFDNAPQYATAGRVVEKTADSVTVEILEGLPRIDGVICYCANVWDLATRRLKHVPSVTYGADVDARRAEMTWRVVEGGNGRRMKLNSAFVAQQVQLGEGLSWHFGWQGGQVSIYDCDRLRLENLLTVNAPGVAMFSAFCKDIEARKIMFRPEGNQLAVGPRDAWMFSSAMGRVHIEGMHIEGVRWDGQNSPSMFLDIRQRIDDRTLLVRGTMPAKPGQSVDFWNGTAVESRVIESCTPRRKVELRSMWRQQESELRFAAPLPACVKPGALGHVAAWTMEDYQLRDCTFERIAGCAIILRNAHAVFEGCRFDNIMYPAITIGASVLEREGPFPQDITIRGCTFSDSGWRPRQDAYGMIGINSGGSDLPRMGKITVTANTFQDAELGLDIAEAREVRITGNRFRNVKTTHRTNNKTVDHLIFEQNRIEGEKP